jgi:hypothetical protein
MVRVQALLRKTSVIGLIKVKGKDEAGGLGSFLAACAQGSFLLEPFFSPSELEEIFISVWSSRAMNVSPLPLPVHRDQMDRIDDKLALSHVQTPSSDTPR